MKVDVYKYWFVLLNVRQESIYIFANGSMHQFVVMLSNVHIASESWTSFCYFPATENTWCVLMWFFTNKIFIIVIIIITPHYYGRSFLLGKKEIHKHYLSHNIKPTSLLSTQHPIASFISVSFLSFAFTFPRNRKPSQWYRRDEILFLLAWSHTTRTPNIKCSQCKKHFFHTIVTPQDEQSEDPFFPSRPIYFYAYTDHWFSLPSGSSLVSWSSRPKRQTLDLFFLGL